VADEAPASLYAAFLHDRTRPLGGPSGSGGPRFDEQDPLVAWLRAESMRVRDHDPASWQAGAVLLHDLGLTP
jgi:hypothetical protein